MFDGFVLVGGKSSRMGENKARLKLGGQTFAERAVGALEPLTANRIYLLNGARTGSFGLPQYSTVADIYQNRGALGGLHAAFARAENEWAAILAGDFPFVTANLFLRLAAIADSVSAETSAIVPIQSDGRMQPLCALYRTAPCLIAAADLLQNQAAPPARYLPENVPTRFVEFAELADLPHAGFFFDNINTPAEYVRAQTIFLRMQSGA